METPNDLLRSVLSAAREIGAVTAAAAALLTQTPATARESDILKGLLQNARSAPLSGELNATVDVPPALIFREDDQSSDLLLAGHRSHSSHSSHRSHVSSSSHASHYSATISQVPSRPVTRPSTMAPRSSVPSSSTNRGTPHGYTQIGVNKAKQPTKAAETELRPEMDPYSGHLELRFQLVSFKRVNDSIKASIFDRKTTIHHLLAVGDRIDDFTLVEINQTKRTVQLKGPDMTVVNLQAPPVGSSR